MCIKTRRCDVFVRLSRLSARSRLPPSHSAVKEIAARLSVHMCFSRSSLLEKKTKNRHGVPKITSNVAPFPSSMCNAATSVQRYCLNFQHESSRFKNNSGRKGDPPTLRPEIRAAVVNIHIDTNNRSVLCLCLNSGLIIEATRAKRVNHSLLSHSLAEKQETHGSEASTRTAFYLHEPLL